MEIKIGIQHVGREIVIQSSESAEAVADLVTKAMNGGAELRLTDEKGNLLIVPSNTLAYVEIGAAETRKVGFGAV